jgi:hypothetical protein
MKIYDQTATTSEGSPKQTATTCDHIHGFAAIPGAWAKVEPPAGDESAGWRRFVASPVPAIAWPHASIRCSTATVSDGGSMVRI